MSSLVQCKTKYFLHTTLKTGCSSSVSSSLSSQKINFLCFTSLTFFALFVRFGSRKLLDFVNINEDSSKFLPPKRHEKICSTIANKCIPMGTKNLI